MTRKELLRGLAAAGGRSNREVGIILDEFLRSIARALSEGETITLRSFGRFEVRRRAGRRLKPPGCSREVQVPARLAPVFRSAPALGRRVLGTAVEARAGNPAAKTAGKKQSRIL
jgi:DNA-binding protein HU-beta